MGKKSSKPLCGRVGGIGSPIHTEYKAPKLTNSTLEVDYYRARQDESRVRSEARALRLADKEKTAVLYARKHRPIRYSDELIAHARWMSEVAGVPSARIADVLSINHDYLVKNVLRYMTRVHLSPRQSSGLPIS